MSEITREAEILEAATQILKKAKAETLDNDAAFHFLVRAQNHLQSRFTYQFEQEFKEQSVLEAETIEV